MRPAELFPSDQDVNFVKQALSLARKGIGLASPNPLVGALIVKDGAVVGEGFYTYDEKDHAEIKALRQAGERAKGGTLYINLEPCCHYGRTPPCVDALIASGIKRVVASIEDPNPQVSGEGFRRLKAAGVEVNVGLCSDLARKLNEAFIKYITQGEPFVLMKAAISLDGKIATGSGESRWITGERAREYVQLLRWQYDAVLVGVNTILKDDPELALRIDKPKRRPLVKVILDSRLRTPPKARALNAADKGEVLIFTTEMSAREAQRALRDAGANVILAGQRCGRVDLRFVCRELARRQISSVIIEGGSEVNWSALKDGIVDKVLFIVAPKIIGGSTISVVGGQGIESLASCFRLTEVRAFKLGQDVAIEGYLQKGVGG